MTEERYTRRASPMRGGLYLARQGAILIGVPAAVLSAAIYGIKRLGERANPDRAFSSGRLTDEDLELARAYPHRRQEFLDVLLREEPIEHCQRLVYDSSLDLGIVETRELETKYWGEAVSKEVPAGSLVITPVPFIIFGRNLESRIYVSEMFFRNAQTIDDAKSVLIDHEGQHVADVHSGFTIGDKKLDYTFYFAGAGEFIDHLREARGYYRQLRRSRPRKSPVIAMTNKTQFLNEAGALAYYVFYREVPPMVVRAQAMGLDRADLLAFVARDQFSAWDDVKIGFDKQHYQPTIEADFLK